MTISQLKARKRSDYKFIQDYRTRWSDNDMYSHMNNSIYYNLFDSIVNSYLIKQCGLQPSISECIGLVVRSNCNYFSPLSFPAVAELGLRVNKLGKSSVTYEIGVFERGTEEVKAVGEFVHVFVERQEMRPMKNGLSQNMRKGLQKLIVNVDSKNCKL